ncbi:Bacterial type II and III secretion system protein [Rubripirellula tenax]|uniref:Bacterial type II and III secretion system protein n=1 Tax=Rubripirellula tenax TaxID=2528015 RepID=A0A5C6FA78_9BACT|nr:type II and III secretion system protein [Rubripirellula tenax]TWU56489.1 Bacterial type II and III secretion system protein [Rubripirellula tenax]
MMAQSIAVFTGIVFSLIGPCALGQLTISDPGENQEQGYLLGEGESFGRPATSATISATAASHRSLARPKPMTLKDDGFTTKEPLTQIRINVRYLMVDAATRQQMYRQLDPSRTRHLGPPSRQLPGSKSVSSLEARDGCDNTITVPSGATVCLLDATDAKLIIDAVSVAAASSMQRSPSAMLLDGKEAEMNDLTQRPFVVDVQGSAEDRKPVIEVFEEGTHLRLRADVVAGETSIRVTARIECSRILDVVSESIFGYGDEPIEIQFPRHMTTVAQASDVVPNQSVLLIDPHFHSTKQIQSETPVPMFGKIPYVGQNFKNVHAVDVEQYLILMLEPSVVKKF